MLKVLVYGTLSPGESNYQPYWGDRVLSVIPAGVPGKLFTLPLGYPALFWDEVDYFQPRARGLATCPRDDGILS